jgi:predicted metal-binding protein
VARVFICTTCNRYAPAAAGEASPGLQLAQAMKRAALAAGNSVAVRMVECLNTCPQPCAAALREPGKAVIRFGRLEPEDAPALLAAAEAYAEAPTGDLAETAMPARLRAKVTGCVTLGVMGGSGSF